MLGMKSDCLIFSCGERFLMHAGLFSCYHNPPNPDVDFGIFNLRLWSFCMHRHPEVLGRLISWTGLFQSLPYPWMVTSPFGDHARSHLAWPLRASTLALRHQLFLSTFVLVFKQTRELPPPQGVKDAYVLLNLGDSVTTDHISPAGSIARNSAAARYLSSRGSVLPLLRVVMIAGVSVVWCGVSPWRLSILCFIRSTKMWREKLKDGI